MINTKTNTFFCYIEFHNGKLILATLSRKKNAILLSNQTKILLEEKEYFNNAIYNPTILSEHIKTFIQKHPKTTLALVALPDYKKCQETHRSFFLFQVALCISQSDIPIHSIISYSLITENNNKFPSHIENLFSLFTPTPQSSPHRWITHTAIATCITISMVMFIQKNAYNKMRTFSSTITSFKKDHKQFEAKTHHFHDLQQKHDKLKKTGDKLYHYSKTRKLLPAILETLATTIPPTTWLKRIHLLHAQGTPRMLEVEGYARSVQEVSLFIRRLEETHSIANLELSGLQKALDLKDSLLFKITGTVQEAQ